MKWKNQRLNFLYRLCSGILTLISLQQVCCDFFGFPSFGMGSHLFVVLYASAHVFFNPGYCFPPRQQYSVLNFWYFSLFLFKVKRRLNFINRTVNNRAPLLKESGEQNKSLSKLLSCHAKRIGSSCI